MTDENEFLEKLKDSSESVLIPLINPDCLLTALLYERLC